MKKTVLLFSILLINNVYYAQYGVKKIKKQKSYSIEKLSKDNSCSYISKIIINYNCNNYLNKKYKEKNKGEVLTVFLKKNKIIIMYQSSFENGVLGKKFDELTNLFDE